MKGEFAFSGTNVTLLGVCEHEGTAHPPHVTGHYTGPGGRRGQRFCLGAAGPLPGGDEELVIVVAHYEAGRPGFFDRARGYWFTRPASGGQTFFFCEEDAPAGR